MNRMMTAGLMALNISTIASVAFAQAASGPMAASNNVVWDDQQTVTPREMRSLRREAEYTARDQQIIAMRYDEAWSDARFRRQDPPIIRNQLPIEEWNARERRDVRVYEREFRSPCAGGKYKVDGFLLGRVGQGGGAISLGDDGLAFSMPLGGNRGDCRPSGWGN